jgi:hypothetical protein
MMASNYPSQQWLEGALRPILRITDLNQVEAILLFCEYYIVNRPWTNPEKDHYSEIIKECGSYAVFQRIPPLRNSGSNPPELKNHYASNQPLENKNNFGSLAHQFIQPQQIQQQNLIQNPQPNPIQYPQLNPQSNLQPNSFQIPQTNPLSPPQYAFNPNPMQIQNSYPNPIQNPQPNPQAHPQYYSNPTAQQIQQPFTQPNQIPTFTSTFSGAQASNTNPSLPPYLSQYNPMNPNPQPLTMPSYQKETGIPAYSNSPAVKTEIKAQAKGIDKDCKERLDRLTEKHNKLRALEKRLKVLEDV